MAIENRLLAPFNAVLADRSAAPLRALHELFPRARTALTTFPELDHFGQRADGNFVGPIYSEPHGALAVDWPASRAPRLLAYLSPATRGLDALLSALHARGSVLACVPDAHPQAAPAARATRAPPSTRRGVHARALQLEPLLPRADLLVTNGALTTSTRALLAGVPVLAVPNSIEQQLGARRIVELGAGLSADQGRSSWAFTALLEELLRPRYRDGARSFASRYAREHLAKAVTRTTCLIEAAARSASAPLSGVSPAAGDAGRMTSMARP